MAVARAFVYGNVQHVGYRAFVRQMAITYHLRGLVRNLPDQRMEIFCDGEEEQIKLFLRDIDIKPYQQSNNPTGGRRISPREAFMPYVERIEVSWGEQAGKPWRKYRGFEIDYSRRLLLGRDKEVIDSLDVGKYQMFELTRFVRNLPREIADALKEAHGSKE